MKPLILLFIANFVLPVAACAAELPTPGVHDQAEAVRDNNVFAIELYGQLRNQNGICFSRPKAFPLRWP